MDIPCPHCGQLNEEQRETCWACYQLMSGQDKPAIIQEIRKTSRIVINGKEYHRLEDVPEQYRGLLKDSDGDGIPDIVARPKKSSLSIKFPFSFSARRTDASFRLDPGAPLSAPSGVRVEDNGMEKSLSWSWFTWGTLFTLFFVVVWTAVPSAGLFFMLGSPAGKRALRSGEILVPLGFLTAGLAMLYSTLAHLLNHTTARAKNGRLSIEHGPLPWWGGGDLALADIVKVDCEEHRRGDETAFQPSTSYRVRLRLRSGRAVNVTTWLKDQDTALFITQFIMQLSMKR